MGIVFLTMNNVLTVIKTQGIIFVNLGHRTVSNGFLAILFIQQCNGDLTKLHVSNFETEKLTQQC